MPKIDPQDKEIFEFMLDAARHGGLGLCDARERATGKVVRMVVHIASNGDSVFMTPIALLLGPDAADDYDPPGYDLEEQLPYRTVDSDEIPEDVVHGLDGFNSEEEAA